jgi:hypothetical protein
MLFSAALPRLALTVAGHDPVQTIRPDIRLLLSGTATKSCGHKIKA